MAISNQKLIFIDATHDTQDMPSLISEKNENFITGKFKNLTPAVEEKGRKYLLLITYFNIVEINVCFYVGLITEKVQFDERS